MDSYYTENQGADSSAQGYMYTDLIIYQNHPFGPYMGYVDYNFNDYFAINELSSGSGFILEPGGSTPTLSANLKRLEEKFDDIYVAWEFEGDTDENYNYADHIDDGIGDGIAMKALTASGSDASTVSTPDSFNLTSTADATYTITGFDPLAGKDFIKIAFAEGQTVKLVRDTQMNAALTQFENLDGVNSTFELYVDRFGTDGELYKTGYKLYFNTDNDPGIEITVNINGDMTDLLDYEEDYGINGFMQFNKLIMTSEYIEDMQTFVTGLGVDAEDMILTMSGTSAGDTLTADVSSYEGKLKVYGYDGNDNITITTSKYINPTTNDVYSVTDDGQYWNYSIHDHGVYVLPGRSVDGGRDTVTERYYDADSSYDQVQEGIVTTAPAPDKLGIIVNGVDDDGDINFEYIEQPTTAADVDQAKSGVFRAEIDGSARVGSLDYRIHNSSDDGVDISIMKKTFTAPSDDSATNELDFRNGTNTFDGTGNEILNYLYYVEYSQLVTLGGGE